MEDELLATADGELLAGEADALKEFALELAERTGVSTDANTVISNIRWYSNKAGAVLIVRKGKDRKLLATISPKKGTWTKLYPSWIPVLAEAERRRKAKGVRRISHNDLLAGDIPQ